METLLLSRMLRHTSQLLRQSLNSLRAVTLLVVLGISIGNVWGYQITFKKNSSDGSAISTSTACSEIVSAGADYLSGNVTTATKAYYNGSNGVKLGTSSDAGTLKMNLSSSGQVTPTSIVIRAKRYSSSKATKIQVNGKTAQDLTSDFADYTFTGFTAAITYLEIKSSKGTGGGAYAWIESITVICGPEAPTFDPKDGTEFSEATLSVSISADEDIYYTLNTSYTSGEDVFLNGEKYTEALNLTATTTIQAVAVDNNDKISEIANATYTKTAPAVHRTVTWYVNGQTYTIGSPTTDVIDGQKVTTLPTEPISEDVSSTTFMGWTISPITTKQASAPSPLFKTASNAPVVSGGDVSYYAVFAKAGGDSTPKTVTWNINGVVSSASGGSDVNTALKTSSISPNTETGVWTAVASNSYAATASQKAQLGSSSYPFNGTITLSGSAIPYTANITQIDLTATSSATDANPYSISAVVGEATFGTSQSLSTGNANCQWTGNLTGNTIVLTTKCNYNKNIVISAFSVQYVSLTYSDYTTKFTLPTYTITFDGNGNTSGSMSGVTGITKGGSTTLVANGFVKTGYDFDGWKDQDDNSYADKATISNITKNLTLTAQWDAKDYEITLDKNGSSEDGSAIITYDATTIEDGYITHVANWPLHDLQGYFTASEEGSKVLNADGSFAEDVAGWIVEGKWAKAENATLYAQWVAQQECNITNVELAGCTADPNNVSKVTAGAENVVLNYILSDNHVWTDATVLVTMGTADLTKGTDFTFETGTLTFKVAITGNINIAISCPWQAATLTLSAIGNEYSFGENLKVNDQITLPTEVIYKASGKTFMGWSSETIPTEGAAPTSNYWAKGTNYTIASTADKLYAVYATEVEGEKTWSVATSIDALAAGNKIAFACINDNVSAASAGKSGTNNYLDSINITVVNNVITAGADKIVPITLGGNATDGWTMFMQDYGYIAGSFAIGSDSKPAKNTIRFSDNPVTLQSISINTNTYETTVTVSGDSVVMYNSNNPRFSIYKSGQTAIKLLKATQAPSEFSNYTTSGTLHVDAPTFDITTKPGTYTDVPHVVKLNVPSGTSLYYTLDGTTEPTKSSTLYNAETGIQLSATATIRAKAYNGEIGSTELQGTFTIHNYNTMAALIANAEHNKAAVLNMSEVYVIGVYTTAKQIFVQEGTKGVILTLTESVPDNIVAGVKLTATASGTYIYTAHNRPQLNGCTLSEVSVSGENQRPASIPVLSAIDASKAVDNLLTLVQINNVYSISKSNNDIVMNSASDESGTPFNVNNLLNTVKNTLPDQNLACNVIGIFYKKIVSGDVEEYSIVPVLESDFAVVTPQDAVLPGIDVVGSTDSENPTEVAMNKIITLTRPDQKYTATYSDNGGETQSLTTQTATVIITNETLQSLTISSTRPYYNDKSITYYYKANSALNEYAITYPAVQTYVGITGAASASAGTSVQMTGTQKVAHYYPGTAKVYYVADPDNNPNDTTWIDVTRTEVSKTEATYSFTMPSHAVAIKMGYTKDPTYSVTYQSGGKQTTSGSAPTEGAKYEGDEVTVQANTWTVNNFIFDKWKVIYETDEGEQKEEHEVTITDGKFTMPAHNVKIIAQWTPTYTVTYDKGSATSATGSVTEDPQVEGAVITLKANGFNAPGYSFTGWKASTDNQIYQPGAVFTMPAEAVTFTAQWDAPIYTKPGAWELVTDASKLAVGDYVIFATKKDQTWYAGSSATKTANQNLKTETNISVSNGVLTYNEEEGKDINDHIFEIRNGNVNSTFAFFNAKTNKYLYAPGTSGKNYLVMDASSESVNASWTISSISNDGEAVVNANCELKNRLSINTTTFSCYDGKQTGLQFYKFYQTARKVYFNANAGEDVVTNMPDMERADPSTNIVAIPNKTPERTGYTFSIWNSAQGGSGTRSANPRDNLELWQAECTMYAQWTKNTPLLTVASVEHGTISAKPYGEEVIAEGGSANVEYQKSVVISHTDDDEQYAFKSWKIYKTDDATVTIEPTVGQSSTTFDMPDYPITVSAIYEDKSTIEFTLTYDANGGEGTMEGNPFTKNWNNYITVSDNKNGEEDIFTKTNCAFTGWNTKADGTGTAYAAGAHFYIKSDVTLYAQWKGLGATYYLDKTAENNIRISVGAAPKDAAATCVNTYSGNIDQVTGENGVLTITISGYAGMVIKNISANVKANGSNSGKMDITIGGVNVFNKTYADFEADNTGTYQSRSFNQYGFNPIKVGTGEDIVIVVTSKITKSAYIQNITIEYGEGYGRVITSTYGTICLDHGVDAGNLFGGTFYEGEYLLMQGGDPYKYYLTEVDHLEAGYPYVYVANSGAQNIAVLYNDTKNNTAQSKRGLIGTLTDIMTWESDGSNALTGYYMIINDQFRLCGVYCGLYANRAYLDVNADDLPRHYTEQPTPVGKRRLALTNQGHGTPTAIDNLTEDGVRETYDEPQKVMIDGRFYILRGEKVYDAQGKLMK